MKNENEWTVDMKSYSRTLEELITTYRILTGLSKAEFRERFWNNEIKERYNVFNTCSGIDASLLNVMTKNISEENKAIQMMAIVLGWRCADTCKYFKREINILMNKRILSIEKQFTGDRWISRSTPYIFVHPMYYTQKRTLERKEDNLDYENR